MNRIKPQIEEILADEQAGFRKGRSTVEQILNIKLICEKNAEYQNETYHNFIDFKKAFDRVWQKALWSTLRKHRIDNDMMNLIESLYTHAQSSVLLNGQLGDWFFITVGVRQGCLLSPTLFLIFLEHIMLNALVNWKSSESIGGRELSNLRFANDIDLIAGSAEELQRLTNRLYEETRKLGMEISAEKSKVMGNMAQTGNLKIMLATNQLEEVDQFKYLGSIITKSNDSETEIKARLSISTSILARQERVWNSKVLSLKAKSLLYKAIILSTLLYGCETWTLNPDIERKLQAFENKFYRKILRVSYTEHRTTTSIWSEIDRIAGKQERLVGTIIKRKLTYFGHISRHNGISKNNFRRSNTW